MERGKGMGQLGNAEYYDQRKGDLSLWEETPTKARVTKGGSVVFSLRFTREELAALQERAQDDGLTLSSFIRRCVVKEMQPGNGPLYTVRIMAPRQGEQSFFALFPSDGPTGTISETKTSGAFSEGSKTT